MIQIFCSVREPIHFLQRPSGEKLMTSALFTSSDFCTLFHGLGVDCLELFGVDILDELLNLVDTPRDAFLEVSQTPSLFRGSANRHKKIRFK